MKFSTKTDILIKNIQLALNTIDTQGLNPILSCILFNIDDNQITITTSNNSCYSQINIKDNFKIESSGKFLVKGKMFLDILETLKSKELNFEIIDDSILRIYDNNFSCNLNILDANSYPTISFQYLDWINFKLSNKFIQKVNNKLINFIAISNDTPTALNGICFDSNNENNLIKVVATDSYHLAYYQEKIQYPKFKIIITQKIINFLNTLITINNQQPILWINNGKLIIEHNENLFFFKLLDMDYPLVYKTLETNYTKNFEIKKSLLIDAITRTFPLVQNNKGAIFNLKINKNKISISAKNNEFGDSFEEIQIENGNFNETFEFVLNARYLSHILKSIDDDVITFNFIDINKPILITNKKEENWKFLILPRKH